MRGPPWEIPTMKTLMSPGEDFADLPDKPACARGAGRCWCVVRWVGVAGVVGLLAVIAARGIAGALRESRRQQCAFRLKQLGRAFAGYQQAQGHFPAPALARREGTPLLSWRVALLPHLGYRALYERFHLDEPWDSPHNRRLLAEMPPEFACPGGPGHRAGLTGYLVVVGPETSPMSVNTPFEPARGVDIREITDGASSTVLVIETDTLVPWTKPDDLRWSQSGPLPHLASPHGSGAHLLFADGSARFLKPTIDPRILLAILTINGGEVVS
jgi:prepilin-type processing-associated H-X9-DG protein